MDCVPSEFCKPDISCNRSGWKNTANAPANAADRNKVMTEGTRRAISTPVTTGTISSHGVIWNFPASAAENSAICSVLQALCDNPATVKITKVMISEGTVVVNI